MAFMDSELEIQIHCKYLYSLSAVEIGREFYPIGGSNFEIMVTHYNNKDQEV